MTFNVTSRNFHRLPAMSSQHFIQSRYQNRYQSRHQSLHRSRYRSRYQSQVRTIMEDQKRPGTSRQVCRFYSFHLALVASLTVFLVYVSVILDESGHRYDAALFQTNPRGIGNKYCHLLILDFHTEVYPKGRRYVTHLIYGMVGGPKTVEALGRISKGSLEEFDSATASISEAVGVFEAKFSHLTGLDWAYRSNQPVKSRFTYIGDGRNSLISGWSNAVSRPL